MVQENSWVICPITMPKEQLDQLTLEDFEHNLDDEDIELLKNVDNAALGDLVSPSPETRLRALKDNLRRMIDII